MLHFLVIVYLQMITLNQTSKILFLGGGATMRNVISHLRSDGFSVCVVTSIRHAQATENGSTFENFLKRQGVPLLVTSTLDIEELIQFCPDINERIAISIGAPWVIGKELIETYFSAKLLNLHGTGLPKNRGGGGFSWQILTRNRFGFCTLHVIDVGVDTGPILARAEFLYSPKCRIPADYENEYVQKSSEFLCNFLRNIKLETITLKSMKQASELSTYWPRLLADVSGWIDWNLRVDQLENFICAFDDPYIGASTYLNNRRVHIKKVSINYQDGIAHPFQFGIVYRKSDSYLCVAANQGSLIIEQLESPTGEDLLSDFIVGDRFITPQETLESAKRRVTWGPSIASFD